MLGETWEDQYRRMHRSYAKLKLAVDEYVDRDPDLHDEATSRDILCHFCGDAFHLKDYIKNATGQTPTIKNAVEVLFSSGHGNGSTALSICADIANGVKHLTLTKVSRFKPPAEVTMQQAGITLPFVVGKARFTYHYVIEAGGKTYTERVVAADAVADWDRWLTGHGFSPPVL